MAPVPVTDVLLKGWALMADLNAPHLKPGDVNWVMMVRSLMAENERLRTALRDVKQAIETSATDTVWMPYPCPETACDFIEDVLSNCGSCP